MIRYRHGKILLLVCSVLAVKSVIFREYLLNELLNSAEECVEQSPVKESANWKKHVNILELILVLIDNTIFTKEVSCSNPS